MNRRIRHEIDMTSGPLIGNLLRFAFPLMLTGILQLLFNAADIVVVGNFAGPEALAAVTSTGSLINLLVNVFMGLSVGASVVVAQRYGAGDMRGVGETVHTAITVAGISSIFVMLLGIFSARSLLTMMDSPPDVLDNATLYMQIYFAGMPFNMLYNFGASIMRAVGDTKRPLVFLFIAGVINVMLNLLLVIVFKMSVAGVAIATVVSQAISMVLVLRCLLHSTGATRLYVKRLKVHKDKLLHIMRVGLPAGLQGSLFSISNVLIQSSINSFGAITMAGNGAAANIEGFIYTSMNALYQADMTFAGQNTGAKKPERLGKILYSCLFLVTIIGAALGNVAYYFGAPLLSIYNTDPAVIQMGLIRLGYVCTTYFLCGWMDVMVGQLRGMGYSIMPMMVSLAGACGFRILWIYTAFAQNPTLHTLYISYPISWGLTALIHYITYLAVKRRCAKRLMQTGQ